MCLPGMMAPIMTRVAWPPQKACIPNHMHETNVRRMTGTVALALYPSP
jgi:hypothetical protein